MLDVFGLDVSSQIFFRLMVSFAFFIGVVLLVSPEAFEALNKSFQKEYGLKIRIFPKLEDTTVNIVDKTIIKHRVFAGFLISLTAFFLLLIR